MLTYLKYIDDYTKFGTIFSIIIMILYVVFGFIMKPQEITDQDVYSSKGASKTNGNKSVVKGIHLILFFLLGSVCKFLFYDAATEEVLDYFKYGYRYVPSVVNMTREEAEKELHNIGFEVEIKEQYKENKKINFTYAQNPSEGEKIKKRERKVQIFICSELKVPSVLGEREEKAKKEFETLGINVQIKKIFSEKVEKNCIISQSIDSGTVVDKNDIILLTVSKGIEMPNTIGMEIHQAKLKLKKCGLNVKTISEYNSKYREGLVINQNKKAGIGIELGDTVTITINKLVKIKVPNLYNRSENYARDKLSKAGFSNINYVRKYSGVIQKNYVISQSENPGKWVNPMQRMTLIISLGEKNSTYEKKTQKKSRTSNTNIATNKKPQKIDIVPDSGGDVINP